MLYKYLYIKLYTILYMYNNIHIIINIYIIYYIKGSPICSEFNFLNTVLGLFGMEFEENLKVEAIGKKIMYFKQCQNN